MNCERLSENHSFIVDISCDVEDCPSRYFLCVTASHPRGKMGPSLSAAYTVMELCGWRVTVGELREQDRHICPLCVEEGEQ